MFLVLVAAVLSISGISIAAMSGPSQITDLAVAPDPVKIGSSAYVQYNLGQDAYVSINVYKESGDHMRTLLNKAFKIAGAYSQLWDGKDKSGLLVPDGTYRIVVEAVDSTGAIIGQMEKLQLAARLPVISNVTDTPDPFSPAAGQQAMINYTISSDAQVTVTILKGYTPVRTLVTNVIQTGGTYNIAWDGKDDYGNVAGDATYTYQIDAVNQVVPGFAGTYKSTVVIQSGPPQMTGLAVNPDPFKIGGGSLNISFDLSKNASVTAKITDQSGNVVQTLLTGVARNAGYNAISWDGRTGSGGYVAEGVYSAVVSAADSYGKSSGDQVKTFTAGFQPAINNPTISPNPFNPNDPLINKADITFNLSNDALVTVEILSGATPVRTLVNQPEKAGDKTFTWDGKDDAGNVVGDGAYYYQINAGSPTVATFKSTYKNSIVVEKGAPVVSGLTMMPDPFKLGTLSPLSIRYDLNENATVYIDIYDSNNKVVRNLPNQAKNAGNNSAVWDGKTNFEGKVPEGIYTVVVIAVDAYGRTGEMRGQVTAGYLPVISNAKHSPEPFNPSVDGSAVINLDLSDNADVTVTILKGFTTVRTVTTDALKLAGPGIKVSWDGKDDSLQPVPDGNYTYQIEAASPTVDSFKSTYKGSITVESSNPAVTDLVVTPAVVKIGSNATFRYTLSEPATVSIGVYDTQGQVVRGFPAETKAGGGAYSITWDTANQAGNPVPSGNYVLKIIAVDSSNKVGAAELAFQAGVAPVISNVAAVPDTVDVAAGIGATISYSISERSYVTVKLYNSSNILWKTLYHSKDVTSSDAVYWDGASDKGEIAVGAFVYKIDANSVLGGIKALQASGKINVINVPGSQPGTSTCTGCHKTYPVSHPMPNCIGCHGGNKPIQDCASCHPTWGSHKDGTVLNNYQCDYCHNSTYSYKIPSHPADIDGIHITTTNLANCQPCHEPPLTKEHAKRINKVTQTNYDCNTCHQSAVAEVVYAISNKLTNCDACHNQAGQNSHEALHTTVALDVYCTSCHINSLTQEHLNNPKTQTDPVTGKIKPWTCDTCHNSTKQIVTAAVYSDNKQCTACHSQGHNVNFVETVPADIPLYAGYNWTVPLNASIWAGESWLPDEFVNGGKVLISNRRPGTQVTGDAVWQFYQTEMAAGGWTLTSASPAAGSDFFTVTFTKGTRKAVIWFYGGETHNATPVLAGGYRIEIIYK